MGQKTHPVGLRVGIFQKWSSSWYGMQNEGANYTQTNSFAPSTSVTYYPCGFNSKRARRGANYISGRERFVETMIKRYTRTKISNTKRLLRFDFRFFKGFGGYTYGFFIYSKLQGRRKK